MRVVHTINSLRSDHGGPSRSVTALCEALAWQGTEATIVTHAHTGNEGEPVMPSDEVKVRFATRTPEWRSFFGTSPFAETISAHAGPNTIVHDHGLWLPTNHAAARAARGVGAPRVVSIRGMLSQWALGQQRAKKRVAWRLYQRHDLQTAHALHATAENEVEDLRRLGLRTPIVLIHNGVVVPAQLERPSSEREKRRVLFLSRVHSKKGLLNLVAAWEDVRPSGWECVLVGPDADGHQREVEQEAHNRGVAADFSFVGEVGDEAKWDLYRSADLFVLPTFSENFGIVVAEALAAGVPVITTTGAPWRDLETHDCGWWVEIGVEPLAAALAEATALPDEARREMGERGRALIKQDYSWTRAADEMAAVYRWLLGSGPRPSCVVD